VTSGLSTGARIRLGILVLMIGAATYGAYRLGVFELTDPRGLAAVIRRARAIPAFPVLMVAGHAVAMTCGLPGAPFTLVGGAIYGTALGSLLNWIGATLGGLGAYGVAGRLGGDAVRGLLRRHTRALDVITERADFATMIRLRLLPVVPFNVINYAAGLAPVRFRPYALSTALGIIPGTVVYTYFADSLVAGVTGARSRAFMHAAIAGVVLFAISFVPALVHRLRRGIRSSPH
jgi:uncharacterized membrane protein YdjX (TVP38/TMEM64 family)